MMAKKFNKKRFTTDVKRLFKHQTFSNIYETLECSRVTFWRVMNGKCEPKLSLFISLCLLMGTTPEDYFD